ncbi:MAG TPA: flavohemoprotein, partial [Pilimelia sp.]|nr:flavohemoprotein [Pilimelia sp.]
AQLGPALAELGVPAYRLEALGLLMAEALRANPGPVWRPDQRAAWQATARLVGRWLAHGMAVGYEPPFWTATVVRHERRRPDTAVIFVRSYLPYPYLPGQFAPVESGHHRQGWRPCGIANLPAADNVVELHVRVGPADPVGAALVTRTGVGDRLRLRAATDGLRLDVDSTRPVLLLAEGVGIAPVRALLAQLRGGWPERDVLVCWGARSAADHYDLPALHALAGADATVAVSGPDPDGALADLLVTPHEEPDVYASGSLRATLAALAATGVAADRIRAVDTAGASG